MYKDCLGIMKEQCKNSRLPQLLMIVVHGETLWSPASQPMDDDDDDDDHFSKVMLACSHKTKSSAKWPQYRGNPLHSCVAITKGFQSHSIQYMASNTSATVYRIT